MSSAFVRLFPVLAVAAHVALWYVALTTLGRLEGPYPTRFDLSGNPTTYTEGGAWLFPALGLFVLALGFGGAALGRHLALKRPGLVNVPRKREWLTLPPEARVRVLEPIKTLLFGLALFTNLLLLSVVIDSYAVAMKQAVAMPMTRVYVAIGGILVLIALTWVQLRRRIGDELRAARREGQR